MAIVAHHQRSQADRGPNSYTSVGFTPIRCV
jgi:hypothetical protein